MPLSPEDFSAHFKHSPLLQGAIGLGLAAFIALTWIAIHIYAIFVFTLSWSTLPIALAIALVQCWLSVGVFIICHDAMHGSLAPGKPRVNALVGTLLLFLYAGFSWKRLRDAHFAHHRHAGKDGDPDFDVANPASLWRWYMTFLRRYFGWQSAAYVSTLVTVYFFIVGTPFLQIVLVFAAPAIASSMQLFYFGTFRPHRHFPVPAEAKTPMLTQAQRDFADRHNARSDNFPVWLSLATCFHFGYHHEHHVSPQTPWWALPRQRRQNTG